MRREVAVLAGVAALVAVVFADAGPLSDSFVDWSDHPAIRYHADTPTDPVTLLNQKIRTGQVRLTHRRGRSLRDLDLQARLLRDPCTYMIYSRSSSSCRCWRKQRSIAGSGKC
jgi:hypothetical protein